MYGIINNIAPDIVAEFSGGWENTSCVMETVRYLGYFSRLWPIFSRAGKGDLYVELYTQACVYHTKEKENRLDGWEKKASHVLLLMREL